MVIHRGNKTRINVYIVRPARPIADIRIANPRTVSGKVLASITPQDRIGYLQIPIGTDSPNAAIPERVLPIVIGHRDVRECHGRIGVHHHARTYVVRGVAVNKTMIHGDITLGYKHSTTVYRSVSRKTA